MLSREEMSAAVLPIWRNWRRYVRRGLRRARGRWNGVDDLTQEVFLRVCRAAQRGDEIRRPKSYLAGTILHVARSHLGRREPTVPFDWAKAFAKESPEDAGMSKEDCEKVEDWLRRLPDEERVVVVARHYLDMSLSEVSATHGWPWSTVKRRYQKGMEALRAMARDAGWYD
jgi:RNA polymerase sigma-70 factor (ECF subfamily)